MSGGYTDDYFICTPLLLLESEAGSNSTEILKLFFAMNNFTINSHETLSRLAEKRILQFNWNLSLLEQLFQMGRAC